MVNGEGHTPYSAFLSRPWYQLVNNLAYVHLTEFLQLVFNNYCMCKSELYIISTISKKKIINKKVIIHFTVYVHILIKYLKQLHTVKTSTSNKNNILHLVNFKNIIQCYKRENTLKLNQYFKWLFLKQKIDRICTYYILLKYFSIPRLRDLCGGCQKSNPLMSSYVLSIIRPYILNLQTNQKL
ncbi:hypothetical protein AGLY_006530 [Aphis glycines]|uniref:Uncharacterized protein n=1 Tax=Aphis glycines TaxID=307491 RepID=A0A6G0TRC3_APHGL|nr:hypothetical protein AGLY_006530 [Aphis glycines]